MVQLYENVEDLLKVSEAEHPAAIQGVAALVIASLASPHWHAKSVILHPAPLEAVDKQARAQDGSCATSLAILWE